MAFIFDDSEYGDMMLNLSDAKGNKIEVLLLFVYTTLQKTVL